MALGDNSLSHSDSLTARYALLTASNGVNAT